MPHSGGPTHTTPSEADASQDAGPVAGQEEETSASDRAEALNRFRVRWTNVQTGEPEEGPLYVLWDLIESYRVDIFEVSLLRITEDFVHFLKSALDLQMELASSFAVMASRLLYYKSRALLPDPGFEESDDEPRLPPELVQQLLEYRKFQMAAEKLRDLDEVAGGLLARDTGMVPELGGDSGEWLDVSVVDMIQAYSRLLRRLDEVENGPEGMELATEQFSVEDKIEYLRSLLLEAQSFSFDELFENVENMQRVELIATFLALLELSRVGEIVLRQKRNFGEIRIFKKSVLVH